MAINPDEAKGRVKKAVGDITDNDELKNEGRVDEASGKVKEALKTVENKAEEVVEKVRDAVKGD
ncbi:MAG: CsbD family protein [Actinomycetota bacterium]|nr:CsbD family protein [Actinomycetota bacterium]